MQADSGRPMQANSGRPMQADSFAVPTWKRDCVAIRIAPAFRARGPIVVAEIGPRVYWFDLELSRLRDSTIDPRRMSGWATRQSSMWIAVRSTLRPIRDADLGMNDLAVDLAVDQAEAEPSPRAARADRSESKGAQNAMADGEEDGEDGEGEERDGDEDEEEEGKEGQGKRSALTVAHRQSPYLVPGKLLTWLLDLPLPCLAGLDCFVRTIGNMGHDWLYPALRAYLTTPRHILAFARYGISNGLCDMATSSQSEKFCYELMDLFERVVPAVCAGDVAALVTGLGQVGLGRNWIGEQVFYRSRKDALPNVATAMIMAGESFIVDQMGCAAVFRAAARVLTCRQNVLDCLAGALANMPPPLRMLVCDMLVRAPAPDILLATRGTTEIPESLPSTADLLLDDIRLMTRIELNLDRRWPESGGFRELRDLVADLMDEYGVDPVVYVASTCCPQQVWTPESPGCTCGLLSSALACGVSAYHPILHGLPWFRLRMALEQVRAHEAAWAA